MTNLDASQMFTEFLQSLPIVSRRHLLPILLVLLVLVGQGTSVQHVLADGPTVKVTQVDMSNYPEIIVYVSVTDDKGNLLGGLGQEDFQVIEDAIPVSLTDFAGTGDVRMADIVFVFDTTTSMVEEVDGMKRTSLAFAEKLERSGLDYRLGLVDFGDVINRMEKPDGQLTDEAQQFKSWINEIRLAGGGYDIPEFSLGALQRATQMSFRDGALKIFILITDAPPHHYGDWPDAGVSFDDPNLTLAYTLQQLANTNVTTYIVAPKHSDYLRIVEETNGQFFNIYGSSDFTTIIDEIGGLIATQYRLAYVSPRPTYDGTRRNIEVTVRGGKGTTTYLEKHLINIQSNVVIALVFLLPLLLALVLPTVVERIRRRPQPIAEIEAARAEALGVPGPTICPHCGHALRPGARFCGRCGQVVAAQAAEPHPTVCPACGRPLRPRARFCGGCGQKL
jgi:hypothetical protein